MCFQMVREPPVVPEKVCYFSLDDVARDVRKDLGSWAVLKSSEGVLVLGEYDVELGALAKKVLIKDDLSVTVHFAG